MSPRRFRPSGSMLVALLALVMAMTGSAVAASLITSKQIKNGTIQTKDISKKALKSLRGQRGPTGLAGTAGAAGAAGAPGAPGAKGDKGDPGPSHSYTDIGGLVNFNGTANNDTTVASVTVPAGTYVIRADVLANNNSASQVTFTCRLDGPTGTTLNDPGEVMFLGPNVNDDRNFFLNSAATTFAGATTISQVCHSSSNSGVYSAHSLVATAVGALN
jgi:hypothetical protein